MNMSTVKTVLINKDDVEVLYTPEQINEILEWLSLKNVRSQVKKQ